MGGISRNCVIAAVSNFSTAYNLVVINIVHVLLEHQYCATSCKVHVERASTSSLVGAIIGQLVFGYVGDCIGRARALQLTMHLCVFGALLSACAVPIFPSRPQSIFTFLAVARLILGVGVGGVYPLSATIAVESASAASRGRDTSLVFSMQGVANLAVPLVAAALVHAYGSPARASAGRSWGYAWRLALGLGALPGILIWPFELAGRRGARTRRQRRAGIEMQTIADGADDRDASPGACRGGSTKLARDGGRRPGKYRRLETDGGSADGWAALRDRRYWGKLVGTAGGWFLFDVTFYGNILFQPTVLREVFSVKLNAIPSLTGPLPRNVALQMAILAAIGLPGYYVAVCLMDRLGRRTIQLQGFVAMGLLYAGMGIFDSRLQRAPMAMLAIYGLTFFFSNFGPNSTTFILPAETFPAHVRTTLNGFSAAMGKLGATVGAALFVPLTAATSVQTVLLACAGMSWLGALVTWAFVEDRRGKRVDHAESRAVTPDGGALEQSAADDRDRDERLGPPAA